MVSSVLSAKMHLKHPSLTHHRFTPWSLQGSLFLMPLFQTLVLFSSSPGSQQALEGWC